MRIQLKIDKIINNNKKSERNKTKTNNYSHENKNLFFFGVSSQWSITKNEGPGFLVGLTRLALQIIQCGRYFEKTVISNE